MTTAWLLPRQMLQRAGPPRGTRVTSPKTTQMVFSPSNLWADATFSSICPLLAKVGASILPRFFSLSLALWHLNVRLTSLVSRAPSPSKLQGPVFWDERLVCCVGSLGLRFYEICRGGVASGWRLWSDAPSQIISITVPAYKPCTPAAQSLQAMPRAWCLLHWSASSFCGMCFLHRLSFQMEKGQTIVCFLPGFLVTCISFFFTQICLPHCWGESWLLFFFFPKSVRHL